MCESQHIPGIEEVRHIHPSRFQLNRQQHWGKENIIFPSVPGNSSAQQRGVSKHGGKKKKVTPSL